MIIELNFEKISKTVKNSTAKPSKLQPLNLSETSEHSSGVHERATDSLHRF